MILIDNSSEKILAHKLEFADSFWSRFRGLMFRRNFDEGEALVFELPHPRKFGVHTFFVFFPIDLVYLDKDKKVLELEEDLSPWRIYSPDVEASYLVELPAGKVDESGIEIGNELQILQENRK